MPDSREDLTVQEKYARLDYVVNLLDQQEKDYSNFKSLLEIGAENEVRLYWDIVGVLS